MKHSHPYLVLCLNLVFTVAVAQERSAQDRREFLKAETLVSEDPRRVPVKALVKPAGIIVLRGGRIFDGTGAPIHNGTLLGPCVAPPTPHRSKRACGQNPDPGAPGL